MRLETARLILREFSADDVSAVLAYQRTPEYQRLRSRASYSTAEAQAFVDMFIGWQSEQPRHRFQLAMSLKSDPRLIGTCGIRVKTAEQHEASLGYELDPAHWARGYATEAARRMIEFGFQELGLHRVEAWCHVDNASSIRVLEKLGMRCEGRSRDSQSVPARWRNHFRFALLQSDWRSGKAFGPSIAYPEQSESLKSMPGESDMSINVSQDELSRIEAKLIAMRNELRGQIATEEDEVGQFSQSQADEFTSQHHGDLGTDMFLEERAVATKKTLESELDAVERALTHISEGSYGVCEQCGKPIPSERLQARPQAIRCIDCERQME